MPNGLQLMLLVLYSRVMQQDVVGFLHCSLPFSGSFSPFWHSVLVLYMNPLFIYKLFATWVTARQIENEGHCISSSNYCSGVRSPPKPDPNTVIQLKDFRTPCECLPLPAQSSGLWYMLSWSHSADYTLSPLHVLPHYVVSCHRAQLFEARTSHMFSPCAVPDPFILDPWLKILNIRAIKITLSLQLEAPVCSKMGKEWVLWVY